MNTRLIIISLMLTVFALQAEAGKPKVEPIDPSPTIVTTNTNVNNSNRIDVEAKSGASALASATASPTINTNNDGNHQNVTFEAAEIPDDITIKRTVGASAPSIDPSHPCALTVSGGFGLTGGGASFGKAYVDGECNARETARLLYHVGMRQAAIEILCSQPSAQGVAGCNGIQDYNREVQLWKYGHDKLVEENTELRQRNKILLQEREHDKARCDESINRATEACRK